MTRDRTPGERLNAIVEQGLCIGCGLCEAVAGSARVRVIKTERGFLQPVVCGELDHATVDRIYATCPGTKIEGLPARLHDGDTMVDEVWGPWRRMVRAFAANPEVRYEGSTGGVLTALGQYLLESERVAFVLHVRASRSEPTFGEPTLSYASAEVLEGAGSRYGPTAPLLNIEDALGRGEPFAFVAKPCDIAALRNLALFDARVDELVRYWLTPVCGGFGPPSFTNDYLAANGVEPDELIGFRYRGRGCPGPTRAETASRVVERHYLDYWGDDETQWSLPWRCKICPDGIGESADIAASDTWPGGSPDRAASADDPGTNALIIRTASGQALVDAAMKDGALILDGECSPGDLGGWQPHQVRKKFAIRGRYDGLREASRIVPETSGLRIDELGAQMTVEFNRRQCAGTLERIAAGKATEPTPRGP